MRRTLKCKVDRVEEVDEWFGKLSERKGIGTELCPVWLLQVVFH